MITPDDGYFFGIGAFETIAVEQGNPQFLDRHYRRLYAALNFLGIDGNFHEIEEKVQTALAEGSMNQGRKVLKLTVSEKNILVTTRDNTYTQEDYKNGFVTSFSKVRRNETSPLAYHKTLNYGDCIMEKRLAKKQGVQEPIFLNSKGQIAEGATSNVFFVKENQLFAPPLCCGMLPGIVREYLYHTYPVEERIVLPEDVPYFDEMFLTNSLLGIMPVRRLENHTFSSMETGRRLSDALRCKTPLHD